MSSQNLDNLVDIGKLKREPPSLREQQGSPVTKVPPHQRCNATETG